MNRLIRFKKSSEINYNNSGNFYVNCSIFFLCIVILPYFIFALFSVPTGDDYAFASTSLEQGILGFIKNRYLTWNGRYTSDFLIAFYNVVGHQITDYFLIKFFALVPLFLLTSYGVANYVFIKLLTGCKNFTINFLYTLIILVSILINTDVKSTIFWLAGGIAYGFANSLLILSFALIIYTVYLEKEQNLLLFGLTSFLIIFINGLSETIMVAFTTLVVTLSILNILLNPLSRKFILKNLLYSSFAFISAIMVVAAPGNYNRIEKVENATSNSGSLIFSAIQSFWSTRHYLFDLINPLSICLFILIVLVSYQVPKEKISVLIQNKKIFMMVMTSLGFAMYMSFFVIWYSLGNDSPPRSVSTSYTLFLLMTIMLGFYCGFEFQVNNLISPQKISKVSFIVVLIFCLTSLGFRSSLLKHDFQTIQKHHNYYQKIYSLAINAKPGTSLTFPPEPETKMLKPDHPFWSALGENENSYANQSFSKYFGLKSVSTSRKK
ncbi:DUF6056 family protein [Crocosphaera sp. XPORK-15E]|uniref:DUF6056 family protein n=1 Tax=Crocosphaera sp. XPORK-15E TaxID=3110247 RepID=UPI002B1ECC83|nr:DUF6056 family protein [Crocosphaera sp. XPORK-15E]MEA5536119.1 DUF6056 family protein [Crocosphaera sp. XPORK-15E]